MAQEHVNTANNFTKNTNLQPFHFDQIDSDVAVKGCRDTYMFETYNSDDEDENEDEYNADEIVEVKYGDAEDFQRPAKLDLIVGFLRCFNFLSCATSVFAVILSLLYSLEDLLKDLGREDLIDSRNSGTQDLIIVMKIFSSMVILFYLLIVTIIIIVDAVGTVTFRWREYGELTHRHTDATSIIFLLGESRWGLRLLASLTMASAASLQTTKVEISPH